MKIDIIFDRNVFIIVDFFRVVEGEVRLLFVEDCMGMRIR